MGYQKSNVLKTLNHWQSDKNEYKYISRYKGFSMSKVLINDQSYYIPPYLRFKNSKFKSLFENYIGVLDFNKMYLYKGEKYIDEVNNMIRYRGLMSFDSDYLIFDPPDNYPAYEYWHNKIHFKTDSVGGVLVVDKKEKKQNVVENVIIPKINRVGLFYGWIRPNSINRFPSWIQQFEETKIQFGLSSIMNIEYLLQVACLEPKIFNKMIKIPRNWILQENNNGIIPLTNDYPVAGFAPKDMNLEGEVEYINGGGFLHKPLRLNEVAFSYLSFGNRGIRLNSSLGSNAIIDNIYLDPDDKNYPKSSWSYFLNFDYHRYIGYSHIIFNEENEKIGEYMFTLDYLLEELKAIEKQTIIKMIW